MEEQIVADLRATSDLAAALGTAGGRPAIDWIIRPDASSLPAITLQRVSSDRRQAHDGAVSLVGARVQFDIWASSYGAARLAFRALKQALVADAPGRWHAVLLGDDDGGVEDLPGGKKVFRVRADAMIWHKED